MQTERNYQFRERLDSVHQAGRRDPSNAPEPGQTHVESGWSIRIAADAGEVVARAARDLQDYFLTSQEVSVRLVRGAPDADAPPESGCVTLCMRGERPDLGGSLSEPGSYRLQVAAGAVSICGWDARAVAQGCYHLEDLMNLAEGPFLDPEDEIRVPLFSPRMAHSGWGLDQFPDTHLNVLAHAGMDAILVYAKGVDQTTHGYLDFNDLVRRAGLFGLDVYFYSTLKSLKHPDDPDAEDFYNQTYGALFQACPGARGVVLVGESCEFPSKDPHTTGKLRKQPSPDGLPDLKPSPGWWPCVDFPAWLDQVKRAIRRHRTDADIVFWTYNWGWAPEADRLKLLQALPKDISLQATFEMNESIRHGDVTHRTCDYTISFEGPGQYFASEAAEAARLGLRLYTMANTGGLTWDLGVIPYVPVPQQWSRRHAALRRAHRDWGLRGVMETHHFGFFPSCVSELAKWAYWDPAPPADTMLERIAERDFGPAGAPFALRAWKIWSDAFREEYACTNEDQYGPFRVGPSYPLIFHPNLSMTFASTTVEIPTSPFAHYGSKIVFTDYKPRDGRNQTAGMRRLLKEQEMIRRLQERWAEGLDAMLRAVAETPSRKREDAERALALGRFVYHAVGTVRHVKEWYRLNLELASVRDVDAMHRVLDALVVVAEAEIRNAEATIPVVALDSRLGWEPSMEYMTDPERIRWKIRQVRRVIDAEIPAYRKVVDA